MTLTAVQITVPGDPKPTARARTGAQGGGHHFTPKPSRDAQDRVRLAWLEAVRTVDWPLEPTRQYAVRVTFHRATFRRADLDNLTKTVLDGLNRVAFPDDSQVTALETYLDWTPVSGQGPSTLVQVRRLPRDMKGSPLPYDPQPTTD